LHLGFPGAALSESPAIAPPHAVTGNPDTERDLALFARLGLRPMQVVEQGSTVHADVLEPVSTEMPANRPCAAA